MHWKNNLKDNLIISALPPLKDKKGDSEIEYNLNSLTIKGKGTKKIKGSEVSGEMTVKVEQKEGRTNASLKEEHKIKKVKGDQSFTITGQENEDIFSYINDGNKKGVEISFDNKNIEGKGRKVGKADKSDTTSKEKKITGSATIDNDGNIEMKVKNEDSNINTHKTEINNFEAEHSKTTSHNIEVSFDSTTKNGQTTYTVGISDSRGTKNSASAQMMTIIKPKLQQEKLQ